MVSVYSGGYTSHTGIPLYSVTQSFANSFIGYVVLNTFNNVSRDEDNILDQIYTKANVFGLLFWRFKVLRVTEENAYLKKCSSLQERAHKIGV